MVRHKTENTHLIKVSMTKYGLFEQKINFH